MNFNTTTTNSHTPTSFHELAPQLLLREPTCILLFSGGRDSTIAALRLATTQRVGLLTVSSTHLIRAERVRERVAEIATIVKPSFWLRLRMPSSVAPTLLRSNTCLPCQKSFVSTGALIAQSLGCTNLAFGYTEYQDTWLEQTPAAKSILCNLLSEHGLNVEFPVEDLRSKDEAQKILRQYQLNPDALEQKCLKQITNDMCPQSLQAELLRWRTGIESELRSIDVKSLFVLEHDLMIATSSISL